MSFIPEEELKSKTALNLAPMIDFLFLMLMFFATLAVTRITTKDTDIELVEIKPETHASSSVANSDSKIINININAEGQYKWVTEIHDYDMESPQAIAAELKHQYEQGLLPEDKSQTQILLKIDKKTPWEPILKIIFAIRDEGFEVRPVYEPEDEEHTVANKR
jgi:biopolymer transport protein ExbD